MFQSPDGDFVYSDQITLLPTQDESISFNPLTGISSILTWAAEMEAERVAIEFQSPDGDFVYSDKPKKKVVTKKRK